MTKPVHTLFLSLGSNIGNKEENLNQAIRLIKEHVGSVERISSFIQTEPWGFQSSNTFLNAAVKVLTQLTPQQCLKETQQIEKKIGRTEKSKDGKYKDRIIDIDLLLYDDIHIKEQNLTIPHPLMYERDFVMIPLNEILKNENEKTTQNMNHFFTSESVSEGHPDKVADQISDAVLDKILAFDPQAKVACETLVTTGQVVLAGEIRTEAYVDLQRIAREVINRIGYTKGEYMFDGNSCGVLSAIHEQSADITRGVERQEKEQQGAGDQGMMFGYAINETENFMPLSLDLAHRILVALSEIRHEGKVMTYLRPDAKSQVTIEYDEKNHPVRIDTIVLSTQHDEFDTDEAMLQKIRHDVINILIPKVKEGIADEKIRSMFNDQITYHVNPTGKFVIGGPHGDTGLTGRKIIVDTYGGRGAHGGGAFSGKDPSKVDRSAAYAARHIAKNMVAAGVADEILVQLSYAIGIADPVSICINTYGTNHTSFSDAEIADKVRSIFTLTPYQIEERLKLRNPIYEETAAYGHMGRQPRIVHKVFDSKYNGGARSMDVELFTWEKLDYVDKVKQAFNIK